MYASKRLLQVTPSLRVLEAIDVSGAVGKRKQKQKPAMFQPFGEVGSVVLAFFVTSKKQRQSGYVPKDAFDISPLTRSVGIVTRDGIVISDPTKSVFQTLEKSISKAHLLKSFAKSTVAVVPDFHCDDPGVALLKSRIEGAKPLGLVRVTQDELMVIYDSKCNNSIMFKLYLTEKALGCYITKRGALSRSAGFVKWEAQAETFVYRGSHVLLISPDSIEVRDVQNGRLLQVIEAIDIRLLYFNHSVGSSDPIILSMKGKKGDNDDISNKIFELAETVALQSPLPKSPTAETMHTAAPELWETWDM